MKSSIRSVVDSVVFIIDKLNRVFEYVGIVILTAMTAVVFVAIISRFFNGISLSWIEESATFAMAWICALGAGLISRRGGMTAIEIGVTCFPKKIETALRILAYLISLVFFVVMIVQGYKMAMVVSTQYAATIPFMSLFWVYIAMPIGFVIVFLNTLAHIFDLVFEKEA